MLGPGWRTSVFVYPLGRLGLAPQLCHTVFLNDRCFRLHLFDFAPTSILSHHAQPGISDDKLNILSLLYLSFSPDVLILQLSPLILAARLGLNHEYLHLSCSSYISFAFP